MQVASLLARQDRLEVGVFDDGRTVGRPVVAGEHRLEVVAELLLGVFVEERMGPERGAEVGCEQSEGVLDGAVVAAAAVPLAAGTLCPGEGDVRPSPAFPVEPMVGD